MSDERRAVPSSEVDCRTLLSQIRWEDGFRCTRCGGTDDRLVQKEKGVRACTECWTQHSLTSGTAMHGRRLNPRTWIRAVSLMVSSAPTGNQSWFCNEMGLRNRNTSMDLVDSILSWMAPRSHGPHDSIHWIAPAASPGGPCSGDVEVEVLRLSGGDRGCDSRLVRDQLDEYLVAASVDDAGAIERLRATRIEPPQDQMAAQCARWAFLSGAITPDSTVRFGAAFARARSNPKVTGPEDFSDHPEPSEPLAAYVRWGRVDGEGTALDWAEELGTLVRDELCADDGCVRRDRLDHCVRKALFRICHPGKGHLELLKEVFARALCTSHDAGDPEPG